MSRACAAAICTYLLCCIVSGAAFAAAEPALPSALKDWRPWALKDLEYRACPFMATQQPTTEQAFVCAWPGRLNLGAGADGANFSVHWRVETPAWIELPGDSEHWPQQVTINQQRQPVLAHNAIPMVWLEPGSYEIAGRIPWRERPQNLRVPQSIGLVSLSVDGKPVVPLLRAGAIVTLGRAKAAVPEADSLQIRVFRKLSDGIPAQLTTQIALAVSGQAREEVIGPVLPEGFEPLALTSAWPARLDADGRLHVQVQPGGDNVYVHSRALAALTTLTAHPPAAPWPKQEIWSYEAAPRLRVTNAVGKVQIDPRQSGVPQAWMTLPAFGMTDGGILTIEQRSRGLAPDEGDRLSLQREAWLDFSSDGWYARDRIAGNMARGWRFDVAAPYAVDRADAMNSQHGGGASEALLVTTGTKPELSGVEWRTPAVDLAAGVRIAPASAVLPVAGWQQTFDRVDATLHFPFGYKLLAAPGADSASGSWISAWSLLDVFVAAIVALLAWRLLGMAGAIATTVFLVLGYKEPGSPLWSLLAVLAFALIVRALPVGRLGRWTEWLRRAALVVLALVALPFLAGQVRYALYPQLENSAGFSFGNDEGIVAQYAPEPQPVARTASTHAAGVAKRAKMSAPASTPAPASPPAPPADMAVAGAPVVDSASEEQRASGDLETIVVTGSRINRADIEAANPVVQLADQIDHYSETTVVQTGRGEPGWNLGSTAVLSWSGPVLPTQNVRLVIAPPWLVRPLRILLAVLLGWLMWRLLRAPVRTQPMRGATIGAAMLMIGVTIAPMAVAQDFPSEQLLQQLRQRLSEAPKCAPACASLAQAQVGINADQLTVVLEAHAGERVALPLPDDRNGAMLKSIKVDGVAGEDLSRDSRGVLWIAVGRGVHRIELEYTAYADKLALAFPLRPARIELQTHGWEASGVADDRLQTETLTLARARDSASAKPAAGAQQFPPYVRVVRSVSLGLEWTDNTVIQRLTSAQGGIAVNVPVLASEHIWTAGIKVQNGNAAVALPDGAPTANWDSKLDKGDTLVLTAPALADRAEVWRIVVSPTWHVEFSGVPGVGPAPNENTVDYRNFEFHPLPGETLTLHITRPAAAQGAARAMDRISLSTVAGQRATTQALALDLRASQGGEQVITLPASTELIGVTRDAQAVNLTMQQGKLSLPVMPGSHRYEIRFRDNEELGWITHTPTVSLGMAAANLDLDVQLPAGRWLIGTWGPSTGPAVLYWGELAVMIVIAFALARTRRTRLGWSGWLLLGLGFSTFSWVALLIVVAWLFAFDWRARTASPRSALIFNLSQAGLLVLTVVALLCLASAIPQGLLGSPEMHITGNDSNAQYLHWFADRTTDTLPQATAISLPLWVYKLLMLAWALWLANALIGWLRDGFSAWTNGGYWRPRDKAVSAPVVIQTPDAGQPDAAPTP